MGHDNQNKEWVVVFMDMSSDDDLVAEAGTFRTVTPCNDNISA